MPTLYPAARFSQAMQVLQTQDVLIGQDRRAQEEQLVEVERPASLGRVTEIVIELDVDTLAQLSGEMSESDAAKLAGLVEAGRLMQSGKFARSVFKTTHKKWNGIGAFVGDRVLRFETNGPKSTPWPL